MTTRLSIEGLENTIFELNWQLIELSLMRQKLEDGLYCLNTHDILIDINTLRDKLIVKRDFIQKRKKEIS